MTRGWRELPARVAAAARRHGLFGPGDTLVVAVSGGADSTALLDLLATLPGFGLTLVAAHLNHALRGADADADAAFVRDLAAERGIPFVCHTVDVRALAARERLNLEDAGRRTRAAFLEEVRQRHDARAIALAHHADDQAETLLMRLLRGSGPTGLAAMAWRNDRHCVRPLLEVSRTDIEAYLNGRGIAWREDATNADTAFLRNRIRHELLPLLADYNPAIRERLAASAAILGREDDLLDRLARTARDETAERCADGIAFAIPRLRALHPALAARLLRLAVAELAGDLRHLSSRHVDDCLDLLAGDAPNRRIALPRRLAARRVYGRLVIGPATESETHCPELTITGPGSYPVGPGATLEVALAPAPADPRAATPDTAWFDPARAPFPWLVRSFRPGDRLRPLGVAGTKKVKELFIDAKLPPSERRRTPLLFRNDDLLWVCGLRRSSLALLAGTGNEAVRVTYRTEA